ncbi:hypothetical protein OZ411_42700, partial [Bradyrhizobium sp. Arg237L]|uniref:hypothetical protein n=1 Tax=Bradyrhizobium sp. Arg237L TaxID=3003352 RepID=UPI00249DDE67
RAGQVRVTASQLQTNQRIFPPWVRTGGRQSADLRPIWLSVRTFWRREPCSSQGQQETHAPQQIKWDRRRPEAKCPAFSILCRSDSDVECIAVDGV